MDEGSTPSRHAKFYIYESAKSIKHPIRVHLSRKDRKRKKYSDEYNKIFKFFLLSYHHKILDFSGIDVKTKMDSNSEDSKFCFKKFDNGEYSKEEIYSTGIPTKHPNILKGVIVSKKSWGLHVKMWSEGISEGLFTKNELLMQFNEKNIEIPKSFIIDLENTVRKRFHMKYL